MPNIKTAISLSKPLFDQADHLAREMQISRSRLFALAVEEFIRRQENRQLTERINAAHEDGLDADEKAWLDMARRHHRQLAEGEW